jgi:hypothetical protein
MQKRCIKSIADFCGLSFLVKLGVEKEQNGYPAKNKIQLVITPNMKEYTAVQQGQDFTPAQTSAKPPFAQSSSASSATSTPPWAKNPSPPPPPAAAARNPVPAWAM